MKIKKNQINHSSTDINHTFAYSSFWSGYVKVRKSSLLGILLVICLSLGSCSPGGATAESKSKAGQKTGNGDGDDDGGNNSGDGGNNGGDGGNNGGDGGNNGGDDGNNGGDDGNNGGDDGNNGDDGGDDAITNFPLQYLGRGPTAYDNGAKHLCTGPKAGETAVLCVRAGAANGGTGTAVAPYNSINSAIASAKAGDIIQVAAGTYNENVSLGVFNGPTNKNLTFLGGFKSNDFSIRDASSHSSIIDGGNNNPAVFLGLSSSAPTVLDGFKITKGKGMGSNWQDGDGHGGGIYIQSSSTGAGEIIISHNEIYGNRSNNHTSTNSRGGGIHSEAATWVQNAALIRIEDNYIYDNEAGKGAGLNIAGSTHKVLRNRFEENIAHSDHGGGVYISANNTEIRDNVIRSNRLGATIGYGWGGGIIIDSVQANMYRNVITGNYAPTIGSGVFWDEGAQGTMNNDLIFANECTNDARSGAAVYVDGGPGGASHVTMNHVTIADHVCPGTSGGSVFIQASSTVTIVNSILWGNTKEFGLDGGSFTITHSITSQAGTGNFNSNPLFVDPANGDYHLQSTAGHYSPSGWLVSTQNSPAIDSAKSDAPFGNEPSPNGGRANLGAYGNTSEASKSP